LITSFIVVTLLVASKFNGILFRIEESGFYLNLAPNSLLINVRPVKPYD